MPTPSRDIRSSVRAKVVTIALASMTAVLLAVGVDRLLGAVLALPPPPISFPPNTSVHHKTVEFDYTATTNSDGFHGDDVTRWHDGVFRIVAIGDSSTYGWGVNLEESWPKVLEQNLRAAGFAVEVLNLGSPGSTTDRYAEIAEKEVDRLLPDLVTVAVLQTDDLDQLRVEERARGAMGMVRTIVTAVLPTVTAISRRYRTSSRAVSAESMRDAWKEAAREIMDGFTDSQRRRYEAFDEEVKRLFVAGEINPPLVDVAVKAPRYYQRPSTEVGTRLSEAVAMMARHLERILKAARSHNANVIVVPLPDGTYVDASALADSRRLGFEIPPEVLSTTEPDDDIALAAIRAGADFLSVTARLRARPAGAPAYFALDGHPNATGHRNFAEALQRALLERGDTDPLGGISWRGEPLQPPCRGAE